jgi:hypothetical protein
MIFPETAPEGWQSNAGCGDQMLDVASGSFHHQALFWSRKFAKLVPTILMMTFLFLGRASTLK